MPRSTSHPSTSVRRSNIARSIARFGFEIRVASAHGGERFLVSFYPEAPYRFGMKTIILSLGVLCAFALFAHAQDVTKATATLEPKSGSQVTGTVTFTKTGDEVRVVADFQNLKPGKHGSTYTRKAIARRRMRCQPAPLSIRSIHT